MRRAGYLSFLFLTSGCAPGAISSIPPVLDLPVPPTPRPPRTATPAPPPSSTPTPQPAPPWAARLERSEKTRAVGKCQVSPFTFTSSLVIENRWIDAEHLAMRVVEDAEKTVGVMAPPGLLGKGYTATRTKDGVSLVDASGAAVPDEEARRILPLATAALAWPGRDVAAHLPAVGTEVASLEGPVATVTNVPLHGAEVTAEAKAVVRFRGPRHAEGGDELVFDVEIKATESDAGMCHHWQHDADAKGEMRLRPADGALLGVHLQGTTGDTEGYCMRGGDKPGPPLPPHACNKGEVTVEMHQPRVP